MNRCDYGRYEIGLNEETQIVSTLRATIFFKRARWEFIGDSRFAGKTLVPLVIGLLVSGLSAYAFSKLQFHNKEAVFDAVVTGSYQVEVKIFYAWSPVTSVNVSEDMTVDIDVLSVFENRELTNFDGNISFTGTTGKNYSAATDISGDAWFTMKVQIDKAQMDAVAANKGNIRLGYRMFFGGELGNSQWENEYELTLKYTAQGRWIVEQMQSWEGWNYYLSQDAIHALTGDGLYIAMHRNVKTGVLTLYYGASKGEMLSNSFTYSQAASKHKENITRFGVAFWSEKGSDYTVTISDLCYGATLEDATQQMQYNGIH